MGLRWNGEVSERKAEGAGCVPLVEMQLLGNRKTTVSSEAGGSGPTRTSHGEAGGEPPRSSPKHESGAILDEGGCQEWRDMKSCV